MDFAGANLSFYRLGFRPLLHAKQFGGAFLTHHMTSAKITQKLRKY